jgi:hypothetical protein
MTSAIKAPSGARPTVEDVALLIRARTKDSNGVETGTFDDDTRPTSDQVEEQIDAAIALVLMRLPRVEALPAELMPAVATVVAYRAALRVEKSYWPEQVRTDRSAYNELLAEYQADLQALVDAATSAGMPGPAGDIQMIPVGTWTSLSSQYSPPTPPPVTPEPAP